MCVCACFPADVVRLGLKPNNVASCLISLDTNIFDIADDQGFCLHSLLFTKGLRCSHSHAQDILNVCKVQPRIL